MSESLSVLVVDDDAALRTAIVAELDRRGYRVVGAGSYAEALAALERGAVDVLVTDLRMDDRDGINLLAAVRDAHRDVRSVLMSAYATARDYQTAVELGAVRVLCKPFSLDELLEAIAHAAERDTGFRGSFHGLSLVDTLQMLHDARRTISVVVERGGRRATIDLEEGEIVHAEHGSLEGVAALRALLAASTGLARTAPRSPKGLRSIDAAFEALLLDLPRDIDEPAQTTTPAPARLRGQRTTSE